MKSSASEPGLRQKNGTHSCGSASEGRRTPSTDQYKPRSQKFEIGWHFSEGKCCQLVQCGSTHWTGYEIHFDAGK